MLLLKYFAIIHFFFFFYTRDRRKFGKIEQNLLIFIFYLCTRLVKKRGKMGFDKIAWVV